MNPVDRVNALWKKQTMAARRRAYTCPDGLHDLVDSYSEANYDTPVGIADLHPSDIVEHSACGQSFKPDANYKITSCKFYLRKLGSPTGNAHAALFAHAGTFGTSSVATGSELATSSVFDIASLGASFALVEFTFTGAQQYTMQANTPYCITYVNPASGFVSSSNYPQMGWDVSSPTHVGNCFTYINGGWTTYNAYDVCFYVYGEPVVVGGIRAQIF